MDQNSWKLIKIARAISKNDPLHGYDLEQSARRMIALINPGAKTFEQSVESLVTVLKSLKQELESASEKLSDDMDASEFAKFFDDAADAESEELRRLLKSMRAASIHVAGPMDWIRNKFKKPEPEESTGLEPSYEMPDSAMNDFVEGDRNWEEPSHYIEKETSENKEFFSDVESLLADIDAVKKKPSKELLDKSIHFIDHLITKGQELVKGVRDHLKEKPAKAEVSDNGMDSKSEPGPAKLPAKLTLQHYVDMLNDALGDEGQTVKALKGLFKEVGPALGMADRAKVSSTLIRTANRHTKLRPVILPYLKRTLGR